MAKKPSKYVRRAAREVDSGINAARRINQSARTNTRSEYAQYLAGLDADRGRADSELASAGEQNRARMANILAARGGSGDGSDQFNYGRLNAQHEGAVANVQETYGRQRGELLGRQGKAIEDIDGQDRAIMLQRTSKIGELARLLEDRDRAFRAQQEQLRMQKAAQAFARARALAGDEDGPLSDEEFGEQLRQLAQERDGEGAYTINGLPRLADFARQHGRSLDDYYDQMGRPELVIAARRRLAANEPFSPIVGSAPHSAAYRQPTTSYAASAADWYRRYGRNFDPFALAGSVLRMPGQPVGSRYQLPSEAYGPLYD